MAVIFRVRIKTPKKICSGNLPQRDFSDPLSLGDILNEHQVLSETKLETTRSSLPVVTSESDDALKPPCRQVPSTGLGVKCIVPLSDSIATP